MTRIGLTLLLFPALASCAPSLLGDGRHGQPYPGGYVAAETEPLWIPDEVKHDPAARSSLMEQLRVQIMQKTHDVPEPSRLVVREQLRRQLDRAGFDMMESTYILSSLDEPRAHHPRHEEVDVARKAPDPGGGETPKKPAIDSP